VPFDQLPESEKAKDAMLIAVVQALARVLGVAAPPNAQPELLVQVSG